MTVTSKDAGDCLKHPLVNARMADAVGGGSFDIGEPSAMRYQGEALHLDGVWSGDGERYELEMRSAASAGLSRNHHSARHLMLVEPWFLE